MALLLAIASACDEPAKQFVMPPAPWVYAPSPIAWPLPRARAQIGRGQVPQIAVSLGIAGVQKTPLRLPTTWMVPGDPARVAIYGLGGGKPAIELVDIDAGRVLWRDTTTCAGPIVGVTADAIVCADATGVRGVSLDGKAAWRSEMPYVAMTGDHVVVGPTGQAVILDPGTGDEVSRVALPAGIIAETIVASCGDAGRELFAATLENKLVRIVDGKGGAQIAWSAAASVQAIDACDGESVLVREDRQTLTAFSRQRGVMTGRITGARGWWPARDGSGQIEVATASGVTRWPRDLSRAGVTTRLPVLGELLAERADRRLVRATAQTVVLLDAKGVAAYFPLAALGAVLGDHALVAASWLGSPAESVRRIALPPRYPRTLRLVPRAPAVAVPAELRDVPEPTPLSLDAAIAAPSMTELDAIALDPWAPGQLYVAGGEHLAAFDLATKAWKWALPDGCGGGHAQWIASARQIIVCGAHGQDSGVVHATSREGRARWTWTAASLDGLVAGGDLVVASVGDRADVLDAVSGGLRLRLASDDGSTVRVALVDDAAIGTIVIAAEGGRLVGRAARLDFFPLWSLAVAGVVDRVSAAGDSVLVELADGDAVRVRAIDGAVTALPALGVTWTAAPDLMISTAPSRPAVTLVPDRTTVPLAPSTMTKRKPAKANADEPKPPRLWSPIAAPVGDPTLQLTLFDASGGVRVRYDYPGDYRGDHPGDDPGASASWVGSRMGDATPVALMSPKGRGFIVTLVDATTGDPLQRVEIPPSHGPTYVFATMVNGAPIVGAAVSSPGRILLF